jgi:hypothetical protein
VIGTMASKSRSSNGLGQPILDFGLPKALEGKSSDAAANSRLSHSPTVSRHATEAGMILGTAAHISPEPARGIE